MSAPALRLPITAVRRLWARRQGLGISTDPAATPGGWMRAMGGIGPYLSLRARCVGTSRAAVDRLVASGELRVSPGVRGCMWVVPRADHALALVVGDAAARRRLMRDMEKLGVTATELDAVQAAVLEALAAGPLPPHALQRAVPDGVVRSLGEPGKKIGQTTTLPPALRLLEAQGRVRRVPPEHRLDTERWHWGLAPAGWVDLGSVPDDDVDQAAALLGRFLQWAAPATLGEFLAWSKLSKGVAQKALDRVDTLPIEVDGLSGPALALRGQLDETLVDDDRVFLLDVLDNLFALRERPAPLVDATWHDVAVPGMAGRLQPLAEATWLAVRPMIHRGTCVGLWDWDPDAGAIVFGTFGPVPPSVWRRAEHAAHELEPLIRDELDGVARAWSIDGPDAQRARAAFVRELRDG